MADRWRTRQNGSLATRMAGTQKRPYGPPERRKENTSVLFFVFSKLFGPKAAIYIEYKIKYIVQSRLFGVAIACVATTTLFYFFVKSPALGVAIVVLGIGAGIMAAQGELGPVAKLLWMIFFVSIGAIEIRSIYAESKIQEQQRVSDQERLDKDFELTTLTNGIYTQGILDNARDQFNASQKKFSGIIGEDLQIKNLSRENLLSITGGDSFPFVKPQFVDKNGIVSLAVINHGDYTLTGVKVSIQGSGQGVELCDVGVIPKHGLVRIPLVISPNVENGHVDIFSINLQAQTGQYSQIIQYRKDEANRLDMLSWVNQIDFDIEHMPKSGVRTVSAIYSFNEGWPSNGIVVSKR